ncbi:MAG: hypothetical protein OEQ18_13290 [Gammaproteobacteria bacterium]|nr:hypothetical protein [Gammaproteobacteria bacterium]
MNGAGFAILLAILFNNIAQASELKSLWEASRAQHYRPASALELVRAEQLFMHMFSGQGTHQEVTDAWSALGFATTRVTVGERRFVVVSETAARRDGRGFFVVCDTPCGNDALQAPHAYTDLYTGTIALQLARSGRFLALAMNTIPRRYEVDGQTFDADMAHLEGTYMIAFSRAYARTKPTGQVVQLHGFSAKKHSGGPAADAQLIISSGTVRPSAPAERAVNCLRDVVGDQVKLYPRDVRELGGTQNRIGAELRSLGHSGFLHIEMEYTFRRALRKDSALRMRLLNCLQTAAH